MGSFAEQSFFDFALRRRRRRLFVWHVHLLRLVVRTQRRVSASAGSGQQNFEWDGKDLEAMSKVSSTFEAAVKDMCQRIGAGEQRMMDRERHFEAVYHLVEVRETARGRIGFLFARAEAIREHPDMMSASEGGEGSWKSGCS